MPNRNYQKGYRQEVRASTDLRAMGYWVQRGHASKGIDVIAVGRGEVLFIEVKSSKARVKSVGAIANKYYESIVALNEIPDQVHSKKQLWVWSDKVGVVGGKNHMPSGWRKFMITNTHEGKTGTFIEEIVI